MKKHLINYYKHIKFNLIFFKSTLLLSITFGLLITFYQLVTSSIDNFFLFINEFLLVIPVGWFFDILYKELTNKEQYYFYYNQGISKTELWIVSFVLSFSFFGIFKIVHILWTTAWKLIA